MSVQRWAKKQKAFTIVELLIAITIIAIVATIALVSYTGAQTRTENTKTLQAVNQYLKALVMYSTQNNVYPLTAASPCLGTAVACGKVSGATTCLGVGGAVTDAAFAANILPTLGSVPEPSTQTMNCAGSQYKGAFYVNNTASAGKSAQVAYFLRGNQTCTTTYGTAAKTQQDDTTYCLVTLPTLPS